jgi:ubiquinone/menaquinone biosynthesis C-methylase UbiE
MTEYLSYTFSDNETFINNFDESPLWSAAFGLLLLKHLELKKEITVIDIGSGAGFPLMELAGRLGASCKLYGLDVWKNANTRARQKIINYQYSNVEIIEASAEKIPFDDSSVDLIVSNLGINNFENPEIVLKECCRVLKPKCKLALTTNLNGHWKQFYNAFESTLKQLQKNDLLANLNEHQQHRGSVESITKLLTDNGFKACRHFEENFDMKFVDGSAFLNHHFVKLGWLDSWKSLLPKDEHEEIFVLLENNLNALSKTDNSLVLTVPMVYIEGEKI